MAGVPDATKGEAVKAWVVLRAGPTASEEELRTFCREELAPYKVPAHVEFRAELPKTMVGKVLATGAERRRLEIELNGKSQKVQVEMAEVRDVVDCALRFCLQSFSFHFLVRSLNGTRSTRCGLRRWRTFRSPAWWPAPTARGAWTSR